MILSPFNSAVYSKASNPQTYTDPYICAMHPQIVSEGAGTCDICGMNLSKLDGHKSGTPLPPLSEVFTSPDNIMYVHEGSGKDPKSGKNLIPITHSAIYEAPPQPAQDHQDEHQKTQSSDESTLYTCGMHPDVIQSEPGNCPICGMALTPLNNSSASKRSDGKRTIAYWVAPMDANFISDKPGKSPMGMDLVPVYEDELKGGMVSIDPVIIQSIGVTTTLVKTQDLTTEIRSNGVVTIAENLEYRVNPKISGWIEKLHVSRTGDFVTKGEALLDIYSPELVSAQEEYLLALKSAEILGGSKLDHVKSSADNLLTAAKRRLELWDINSHQIAELESSRQVKRTLTLYSPVEGIVMHKNAVEGAAFKAGMDLYRIVDLSTVWVDAQIFEYELPWVKQGNAVSIKSAYNPDLTRTGIVDTIYPYLDAKTRTANIRVVISNLRLELRPEMYVDVRIDAQSKKNATVIPKNTVIRSGTRDIVFVALGNGRFMPREISIGLETTKYYEVTSGLTAGNEIVSSAQFLLDSEENFRSPFNVACRLAWKRRTRNEPDRTSH